MLQVNFYYLICRDHNDLLIILKYLRFVNLFLVGDPLTSSDTTFSPAKTYPVTFGARKVVLFPSLSQSSVTVSVSSNNTAAFISLSLDKSTGELRFDPVTTFTGAVLVTVRAYENNEITSTTTITLQFYAFATKSAFLQTAKSTYCLPLSGGTTYSSYSANTPPYNMSGKEFGGCFCVDLEF